MFFFAWVTVLYRLAAAGHPASLPNFNPMVALTLVAAAYLGQRYGWLIGALVYLMVEFSFIPWNHVSTGSWFSPFMILGPAFYAGLGWLGCERLHVQLANRSLWGFICTSIAASVSFYLMANTVSWWGAVEYPQTLVGWVQANTTGLPGYPPAWIFLRNAVIGDIFFTVIFVSALEFSLVRQAVLLFPKVVSRQRLA